MSQVTHRYYPTFEYPHPKQVGITSNNDIINGVSNHHNRNQHDNSGSSGSSNSKYSISEYQDPWFQYALFCRANEILQAIRRTPGYSQQQPATTLMKVYETQPYLYHYLCQQAEHDLLLSKFYDQGWMNQSTTVITKHHNDVDYEMDDIVSKLHQLSSKSKAESFDLIKHNATLLSHSMLDHSHLPSRQWNPTTDEWIRSISQQNESTIVHTRSIDPPELISPSLHSMDSERSSDEDFDDISVPATSDSQHYCELTGERFEAYWSDKRDSWMYKNTIQPYPNGPIYNRDAWLQSQYQQSNPKRMKN